MPSYIDIEVLNTIEEEFNCTNSGEIVSHNFRRLAELIRVAYNLPPPNTLTTAIDIFSLLLQIFE